MASTPPPPPVIGKAGNLTVFITPPSPAEAEAEGSPDSPRSEFTTPSGSPRAAEDSTPPPSPPRAEQPPVKEEAPAASPQLATPPPVKTVSPPLPAAKLSSAAAPRPPPPVQVPLPSAKLSAPMPPPTPPPVQVPPPQFEKAEARPDGSMLALFWDTVARVQEAHASLDEYISNWFGLDQSKYQWALNEYYESNGKDMESGKAAKPKELGTKLENCVKFHWEVDTSSAATSRPGHNL
uniref:Uncharacterized protein n=2 Tax=Oryza TaxID=4527 RepID=A0A0E0P6S4_ORYRU